MVYGQIVCPHAETQRRTGSVFHGRARALRAERSGEQSQPGSSRGAEPQRASSGLVQFHVSPWLRPTRQNGRSRTPPTGLVRSWESDLSDALQRRGHLFVRTLWDDDTNTLFVTCAQETDGVSLGGDPSVCILRPSPAQSQRFRVGRRPPERQRAQGSAVGLSAGVLHDPETGGFNVEPVRLRLFSL